MGLYSRVYDLVRTDDDAPCTHQYDEGLQVDLSALTLTNGTYSAVFETSKFDLNVCDYVAEEGDCELSTLCETDTSTGEFLASLAQYDPAQQQPDWGRTKDGGVTQIFTNGDECTLDGEQLTRNVTIVYACGAPNPERTFAIERTNDCAWLLTLEAELAWCDQQ